MELELELRLALPNHSPMKIQGLDLNCNNNGFATDNHKDYSQKRVFGETALSLMLCRGQPEEEDRSPKWRRLHIDDERSDDECQVIEPPRHQVRKSMHVKVKMEGVAIGRKVDLRHYHSYQQFTIALIQMFDKYSKMERSSEEYRFLYQDKEGDWMIVGDVQWGMFVESVQRVEILKNDNEMGFRLLSSKI